MRACGCVGERGGEVARDQGRGVTWRGVVGESAPPSWAGALCRGVVVQGVEQRGVTGNGSAAPSRARELVWQGVGGATRRVRRQIPQRGAVAGGAPTPPTSWVTAPPHWTTASGWTKAAPPPVRAPPVAGARCGGGAGGVGGGGEGGGASGQAAWLRGRRRHRREKIKTSTPQWCGGGCC